MLLYLSFAVQLCLAITALATPLQPRANLVPSVNSATIHLSGSSAGGPYPRVTSLSDGSYLACYTAISGGTKTLTVTRSTDGAQTWTQRGTIAQSTGDLDNCYLLQLANGDVVAAFRNHDLNSAGQYTEYRITTCISHDSGATWTFLSQVEDRVATATNNGVWEPFLRLSRTNGALQVYYASENSAADQDILMKSSTNNGVSWSASLTVAGGDTTGRDGMPGCSNLASGTLMCVFETTQVTGNTDSPNLNIKSVISTNEGASWGSRSQVYIATAAEVEAAAPQIVTKPDGGLVVSFYTNENNVANSAFKIVTSGTGAAGSWSDETTVATASNSAWPGLLALPNGSVLGCSGSATCHMITFS
ncbi:glycoside hydrolase family 93 protein [Collybiopsis luxurians FD-317 M1]|uniref:Glycoside hydrolase family 93 protein n=1 Tax=Collybiopsis luxurians FD-317 M1 TaxID=944289 RepID=A0A0D0CUC5_9AGAR|nr:glycoside hydrolase family 93 protein [Collybiopsis luxurians FD-317 M1]